MSCRKAIVYYSKSKQYHLTPASGYKTILCAINLIHSSDTIPDDNILIFASIYIESLPTVKRSIPLCSTTRHVSGLERWRAGVFWYKEAIVSQRQPSRKLLESVSANINNMLFLYECSDRWGKGEQICRWVMSTCWGYVSVCFHIMSLQEKLRVHIWTVDL